MNSFLLVCDVFSFVFWANLRPENNRFEIIWPLLWTKSWYSQVSIKRAAHLTTYSRVPNKRTGRLLENEKKSHLYALIQTYTFINFQQKVPPIRLFPLTLLLIFVLSMAHFDLRRPQKPLWGHNQKLINYKRIFYWNTKQPLLYPIECFQKSHLYVY